MSMDASLPSTTKNLTHTIDKIRQQNKFVKLLRSEVIDSKAAKAIKMQEEVQVNADREGEGLCAV